MQKKISVKSYTPTGFMGRYRELIRREVIPYQYQVLCDKAEGAEKSHVVDNFINAGKALRGEDVGDGFYGMVFQDSDAAKWLEAVGFSLAKDPDPELEATADRLIDIIAEAQDSDGYLDTYFTIKDREKRWKNLLEGHELYCAGHMMEAAVAYYEATGKDKLLKVMEKNMEHIYNRFITEGTPGYPGHPEVELALVKLYNATGNPHALELAEHFINVRGVDTEYYKKERASRDWTVWGNNGEDNNYQQSYAPVREQSDAVGHSVRAVYLYTGMAEIAAKTGDKELLAACRRLWDSITRKRMYVTGGIGSAFQGEAFTADYDLPNDTAYAETCASIGLIYFASAMLDNEIKGEYGDIMERAFYNTVLAGMQLDGKRFFYVNPLEVIPGISGKTATHWHTLPQRPKWHACACCPPNVARTVSSIGCYAYGESSDTVFCHLFAAGKADFDGMSLECDTEFPYGFTVKYTISGGGKKMAVRVPAWSESYKVMLNGSEYAPEIRDGYAYFGVMNDGDTVEITLDDRAKFVYSSTKVAENTRSAAVQRGALIYCFEGVDNDGDVLSLCLDTDSEITVSDKQFPDNATGLEMGGGRAVQTELYSFKKPEMSDCRLTAIPYYTWGNRGETEMRVWLPIK